MNQAWRIALVRIYGSGVPKGESDAGNGQSQSGKRARSGKSAAVKTATAKKAAQNHSLTQEQERLAQTIEEFRGESLEPFSEYTSGNPFGLVVAVSGRAIRVVNWAGEASGANAPSIEPGDNTSSTPSRASRVADALEKAVTALGYPDKSIFWVELADNSGIVDRRVAALRSLVELVDPVAVVALDQDAGMAIRSVYSDTGEEPAGWIMGRKVVFLEDFAGAILNEDVAMKRRDWVSLKKLQLPEK